MADEDYEIPLVSDESAGITEINNNIAEVKAILSQQPAFALKTACDHFPHPTVKNTDAKQSIVTLFTQLFNLVPPAETFVKEFSPEQRTNLLKYTYKVMHSSAEKKVCDNALLWNGFVIKIDGPGAISRVISDRNL